MVKEEDDANFVEADQNRDKTLDFEELLAFMTTKGGLVWEAEADEFFMYVDQNKDDKITVEELQDAKYLNPVQTLYKMSHHMAKLEM
jgi:Ca2+-binding EF-hand superfamily protein